MLKFVVGCAMITSWEFYTLACKVGKGLERMGRHVKNGRYVNVNISLEAFEALERHCSESGQTKTVAVERAVMACYGVREAPSHHVRSKGGCRNAGK